MLIGSYRRKRSRLSSQKKRAISAASASGRTWCTPSSVPVSSSTPGPNPADSKAADLRIRLDLLLGEHVVVVAKQAVAAANHTDEYTGYATLLTTNADATVDVMRSAYGNTAATQLDQVWRIENGYVIDYTIGVVTHNDAGRAALRAWVGKFCDAYAAHGAVLRVLTQAEVISDDVWSDGLQLMFRLAEAMTTGMTAAPREAEHAEHAELTAVACLMMLERVNFLFSVEVRLPREEMMDRLTAIIFAAFGN